MSAFAGFMVAWVLAWAVGWPDSFGKHLAKIAVAYRRTLEIGK